MAACTAPSLVTTTVYFFDSTGSLKWSYPVDADKLSISSDGATLAVGAPAPSPDTAYLISTGFQTPTHVGPPVGGFIEPSNKISVLRLLPFTYQHLATQQYDTNRDEDLEFLIVSNHRRRLQLALFGRSNKLLIHIRQVQ